MTKRKKIVLPTPKGKRKSSRFVLETHMHPSTFAKLAAHAASVSLSLTAYVEALIDYDPNDDAVPTPTLALARQVQESRDSMLKQHLRETGAADGGQAASDAFWARRALGVK